MLNILELFYIIHLYALKMRMEPLLFSLKTPILGRFHERKGVKYKNMHIDVLLYERILFE